MAAPINRIAIIRDNDTDIEDAVDRIIGLMGAANVVVVNAATNPFPTTIQAVDFDFYVISGTIFPTLQDQNLMTQLHQHAVTHRRVIFVLGKDLARAVASTIGIPEEQRDKVRCCDDVALLVPMICTGIGKISRRHFGI